MVEIKDRYITRTVYLRPCQSKLNKVGACLVHLYNVIESFDESLDESRDESRYESPYESPDESCDE